MQQASGVSTFGTTRFNPMLSLSATAHDLNSVPCEPLSTTPSQPGAIPPGSENQTRRHIDVDIFAATLNDDGSGFDFFDFDETALSSP